VTLILGKSDAKIASCKA